jgi:hypothetical protein
MVNKMKVKTCSKCAVFFERGIAPGNIVYGECRLHPPKTRGIYRRGEYPVFTADTPGCSMGCLLVTKKAPAKKAQAKTKTK